MSNRNLERAGRAGKREGMEVSLGRGEGVQNRGSNPDSSRQVSVDYQLEPCRSSLLPLQWKITHSSRWVAQVLASELSLLAFILLLGMVFSKKWLYLSRSRFHQHWPANVTTKIYTSAHIMSLGLLQICKSKSCANAENGKGEVLTLPRHPRAPACLGLDTCTLVFWAPRSGHPHVFRWVCLFVCLAGKMVPLVLRSQGSFFLPNLAKLILLTQWKISLILMKC